MRRGNSDLPATELTIGSDTALNVIVSNIDKIKQSAVASRIQATRLTARCVQYLSEQLESGTRASAMIGFQSGRLQFTELTSYPSLLRTATPTAVRQVARRLRPVVRAAGRRPGSRERVPQAGAGGDTEPREDPVQVPGHGAGREVEALRDLLVRQP